jgi:hypothetical protein
MIILTKKAFATIYYTIMLKTLMKLILQGSYLNIVQAVDAKLYERY